MLLEVVAGVLLLASAARICVLLLESAIRICVLLLEISLLVVIACWKLLPCCWKLFGGAPCSPCSKAGTDRVVATGAVVVPCSRQQIMMKKNDFDASLITIARRRGRQQGLAHLVQRQGRELGLGPVECQCQCRLARTQGLGPADQYPRLAVGPAADRGWAGPAGQYQNLAVGVAAGRGSAHISA